MSWLKAIILNPNEQVLARAQVKRRINTLLHNPNEVKRKYGMILRFLIRRAPVPIYYEDYNAHWSYFSFKDKTILDLGADYGSTAYFFVKNGASKVIAVEGDKTSFKKLQKYALKCRYIVPIELMIDSKEDIKRLISTYSPDIVKVDIEGAERLFIDFSRDYLSMVDEWLIETHEPSLSERLVEKFSVSGFSVKKIRQSEVHDILVIERKRSKRVREGSAFPTLLETITPSTQDVSLSTQHLAR